MAGEQAGRARVWRNGNFQLGFAAGKFNSNGFDWRRKWRISRSWKNRL
jgi:hypothetical protein